MTENIYVHESTKVSDIEETEGVECPQCALRFKSYKNLRIHIGKAHKNEGVLPTPEKERCSSPLLFKKSLKKLFLC